MRKIFRNKKINPIMAITILILITIVLSGILNLAGFESTYYQLNESSGEYEAILIGVDSLFNLAGLKYIFSTTVSNFAAFTPLNMLIIVLIGIGIMEKSGFLKVFFTLLTKNSHKNSITFGLVFISMIMSLFGNIGYVIMIPISALLFQHGRRNPILGIVTSFAALTCGSGLSLFFTSTDSMMLVDTMISTSVFSKTELTTTIYLFIMPVAMILTSLLITFITEKISVEKVAKYEFKEEKKEFKLARKEVRGLLYALIAGVIYLSLFIYQIIPNVPLGGNLLDNSQAFYIDKLFSPNSFFNDGFVFIVTLFFIILGLFYGLGSKNIKTQNDFFENIKHSLDGLGSTIVFILFASVLINVFKRTNIGMVIIAQFADIMSNTTFTGIPLIIILFLFGAVSTFFMPSSTARWKIMASAAVPTFMEAGLTAEFSQLIFRVSEGVTMGLTPLLAYFVIYLAFVQKYNQEDDPITLGSTMKYQIPYSMIIGIALIVILILWYLSGLPLGIGGTTAL